MILWWVGTVDDSPVSLDKIGVVEQFKEVFAPGIGKLNTTHHIELKPGSVPFCAASRQVPERQRCKLKAELDRLVQEEVIAVVNTPSEWVHPIVVVDKAGTD